jgi:hypothetical protein
VAESSNGLAKATAMRAANTRTAFIVNLFGLFRLG